MAVIHHPTCTADYPEKVDGELPQQLSTEDLGDGAIVITCVDCGAFELIGDIEDPESES